jgi:hypothetical protein
MNLNFQKTADLFGNFFSVLSKVVDPKCLSYIPELDFSILYTRSGITTLIDKEFNTKNFTFQRSTRRERGWARTRFQQ